MAIDPKKTMVKVLKKTDTDKKVSDKETASESKIELTQKYSDSKETMAKNIESNKGKAFTEKAQGISIEKKNLAAKPVMFKRKVIKTGGENGTTKILSSDGKTVKYEGRSNMSSTKEALRINTSQENDTNSRRSSNSNNYNVNSGAKAKLDDKDQQSLIKTGKAILKK